MERVTSRTGPFSHQSARAVRMRFIAGFGLAFVLLLSQATRAQTYRVVHRFNGTDGRDPVGTLVRDSKGTVYGVTVAGGLYDQGTVFKFNSTGLTTLYSFSAGTDGCAPQAGLIRDPAGNLYGTTSDLCFSYSLGTIFKIDANGAYRLLYNFKGRMHGDGEQPWGKLVRDKQGNLYGTTESGGNTSVCGGYGCGLVFKLDTHGSETVLHAFNDTDGSSPFGALILSTQGDLYGTTWRGGRYGFGTIFRISNSVMTVLHNFAGTPDGANPMGTLILDSAGNLFGATETGGVYGFGTAFKLDAGGTMTVLYSFTGGADGRTPLGGLVEDSAGNLFGTTVYGGTAGSGNVFELSPDGVETVLHSFSGKSGGTEPYFEELILDAKGNLYGTTATGGTRSGYGVLFRLAP